MRRHAYAGVADVAGYIERRKQALVPPMAQGIDYLERKGINERNKSTMICFLNPGTMRWGRGGGQIVGSLPQNPGKTITFTGTSRRESWPGYSGPWGTQRACAKEVCAHLSALEGVDERMKLFLPKMTNKMRLYADIFKRTPQDPTPRILERDTDQFEKLVLDGDKEGALQAFQKYVSDIPRGPGVFNIKNPKTFTAPPPPEDEE